jgi:hypothetical protein
MTLVLGALMLWALVGAIERPHVPPPHSGQPIIVEPRPAHPSKQVELPVHRYPSAPPALPPANTVPEPGMRYPSVPKFDRPRNAFEQKQLDYTQKVRQQRQQTAPKPGK